MEHILLIDDEVRILHSLKLALYKEKYRLHFANCADEALEIVRKHEIAVVVSDHKMPGTKGVDLLTEIRRVRPRTIRILLTGECDHVCTIDSINKAHVYLYINKPFSGKDMRKILSDALNKYHEGKVLAEVTKGQVELDEAIQMISINTINSDHEFILQRSLVPGMKLITDVKDDDGRLIAKAGHILTRRDLQIMKSYPITDRVAIKR